MKKYFLPVGIVMIVMGAVAMGMVLVKQESPKGNVLSASIDASEHRLGNTQSQIQLIEYADFQCPACASFDPLIKKLLEENGDWINFAYRHFPLKEIHKNATKASYASEAASEQNRFWEYKEMLYQKQNEWAALPDPAPKFMEYAQALGLDESRFIRDFESDKVRFKVDSDYQTGLASGFNSTPTFVVNGRQIANPATYEQFVELLRNEIQP